jgi:hypothetical protein
MPEMVHRKETSSVPIFRFSEGDLALITKRHSVIAPLIDRPRYAALWSQHGQSVMCMVDYLAVSHGIGRRTIRNWWSLYNDAGLHGLVRKRRSDRGRPRVFNQASLDFLLAAAVHRQGDRPRRLSVAAIRCGYVSERAWRRANAESFLGAFEKSKYSRFINGAGRLSSQAQFPRTPSEETFRVWLSRPDLREVVLALGRNLCEKLRPAHETIRAVGAARALTERELAATQLKFLGCGTGGVTSSNSHLHNVVKIGTTSAKHLHKF